MGLKKGIWKWRRIFTLGLVGGVLGRSLLYYFESSLFVQGEVGEVKVSQHKIIHTDWFKFCALHNKMYDERKGNAGGIEQLWKGRG